MNIVLLLIVFAVVLFFSSHYDEQCKIVKISQQPAHYAVFLVKPAAPNACSSQSPSLWIDLRPLVPPTLCHCLVTQNIFDNPSHGIFSTYIVCTECVI